MVVQEGGKTNILILRLREKLGQRNIGDDINDVECLEFAKYKITVPHAVDKVKAIKGIQITKNEAGNGAFREVVDCLVG